MTTQLERMKNELLIAGYNLEPVNEDNFNNFDYAQNIGLCAWEVCQLFCKQGHSGMSAEFTIALIERLLKGDILTPLTNNPDEWMNVTEMNGSQLHQSKRKFSCFSDDNLKTFYDIDEECNKEFELDENGEKTGWCSIKPREQLVRHELKEKE